MKPSCVTLSITTATVWPRWIKSVTMHGHKSPRADIVIWKTPEAKAQGRQPVLVVKCKAESVDINLNDYY